MGRWVLFLALLGGCEAQRPAASSLTKGPWVERVDETHAMVSWESATQGPVELAIAPEGGAPERFVSGDSVETHVVSSWGVGMLKQPDLPGTYYRNQVALDGLQAGTCYAYRMRASGTDQTAAGEQKGRFCTARPSGADFGFFAIGDTNPILGHTKGTLDHTLVQHPDFTLHLGDMQYYSSAAETWAYWFGAMAPLLRAGAIFPTIGNHENENNGTEYDDYYDRLFAPASTDLLPRWYHFENGGVWFFALDTESPRDPASDQYKWLSQALSDATQAPGFRFSVVFMHRPMYTLGDADPQIDDRHVFEPIFQATGVKLVLAGHMHGYERFEPPSGITFMTCAGGGGIINDVSKGVPNYPDDVPLRVAFSDHYSGCLFSVRTGELSSTVIDEFGATLDQFSKAVP
jgi:hypothetical protein